MRITTGQLRQIVINPAAFVRNTQFVSTSKSQFGNPQRNWMEGAWKAYFESGRQSNVLWNTFDKKVGGSGSVTPRRRALALGAVPMLHQFLRWDQFEPAPPTAWFLPLRDVEWEGHTLSIKRDTIYLTETGYRIRQYWTDTQLKIDDPDVGLMVAGVLVYSDIDLGLGRVENVEVWQLRTSKRRSWNRRQLDSETVRLKDRLDEVSNSILSLSGD